MRMARAGARLSTGTRAGLTPLTHGWTGGRAAPGTGTACWEPPFRQPFLKETALDKQLGTLRLGTIPFGSPQNSKRCLLEGSPLPPGRWGLETWGNFSPRNELAMEVPSRWLSAGRPDREGESPKT